MAKRVTATQFARNLSAIMNEVRYRAVHVEVVRGKEVIARVMPPETLPGFPIEELNFLLAAVPKLGDQDAAAFLEDLRELDGTLHPPSDAWGS